MLGKESASRRMGARDSPYLSPPRNQENGGGVGVRVEVSGNAERV